MMMPVFVVSVSTITITITFTVVTTTIAIVVVAIIIVGIVSTIIYCCGCMPSPLLLFYSSGLNIMP